MWLVLLACVGAGGRTYSYQLPWNPRLMFLTNLSLLSIPPQLVASHQIVPLATLFCVAAPTFVTTPHVHRLIPLPLPSPHTSASLTNTTQ